jgi:ATP-binding cassette subfamily B protein
MIREALDTVVAALSDQKQGKAPAENIGTALAYFGGLVLLFALLMGICMYFMRQTLIVMSRLIEYDLRSEIFAHYEQLDLAFYKQHNTGDLMVRISEDVSKVRNYLGPAVLYGINLVTLTAQVLFSMFQVSWELTLWSLLPLPILSISIFYVSNAINRRSERIQAQLSVLNNIAQEVYSGIRVVKSYVQVGPMSRWFADETETYRHRSLKLARISATFFPLMLLLIGASTILTVYVGGILVSKGTITPGNIAEFVIYVNMLTFPVTAIGWIASLTQQASASMKRINEYMNTTPAIKDDPAVLLPVPPALDGSITFDHVSFTYPDKIHPALQQVSFQIQPGQKIGIIGRTGSGKTTIADLLVRMYDYQEGAILLDGRPLKTYPLDYLRKRIAYVPQDVFLFSDTVSANILFGTEGLTQEDAERYAAHAAIHEEILGLTEGYQTLVGERGVTLSGGQKQRISIARAFVRNPDIVLLDDCLSAVDTDTEAQIVSYLQSALADKTALVITHRIYGQLQFDHILVMEEGRIIEQGTHESLMQAKGYYAEQYERQKVEATTEAKSAEV